MKYDNLIVSFLIFFLSLFNGIAQTQKIPFDISYTNHTVKNLDGSLIINADYKKLPSSSSFGWDNGIYWFKLKISETKEENTIVYFPTHNISKIELYSLNRQQLTYISSHGNEATDIKIDYRFPAFKIKDISKTYYLKVNFKKEANFPVKIISETNFYSKALSRQSLNFFYYGFCLIAVLVNFFFYIKFKKKTFLYYSFFLTLVMLNILHIDGMFSSFFRNSNFINHLDPLIHLLEEISIILFSISFLELHNRNPKFCKYIFIAPIVVTICYLTYLITDNFKLQVIGDIIAIPAFIILWGLGIYYIKQLPYAKFYALGYILLLPTGSYYFIGYSTGLWAVDGDLIFVKISSILDVLIFTYAISYRMKVRLNDVNKKLLVKEANSTNNSFYIFLQKNKYTNEVLTIREIDVLKEINSSKTNREIAEKLFVSESTIKTHLRNIYKKFDVKNRKQLQNTFKKQTLTEPST
ncbi:LuxR C-terminal-related transcriptional regulator [Flavobacteriaceae bacterium]|nr:LuxR C-terminal-related transcriptional regulator [Flavobacteriaceae bacterium]